MRIGIDLRCLQEGKKSGVSEYAFRLFEALFRDDPENHYLIFLSGFKDPAPDAERFFGRYPNVTVKKFRFPNKLLNFLLWYARFPKIDRLLGGTDILFLPNINFASWSRRTKTVLTIHDLSFERYPETFSWKRRLWHFLVSPRNLVRRANMIVAVSESTGADLEAYYGIGKEKIRVVPSGLGSEFSVLDRNNLSLTEVQKRYQLPYRFILYLGTIEPRKNLIALIRAFNSLKDSSDPEIARYHLVLAGAVGWKAEEILKEIKKSRFNEEIHLIGMVAEEDKPAVYNLASIFVYPSFFEGFGFPPLEAFACGIPVVTSNNSSLPEISGSAAILIDPEKPDEICQAVKEILKNRVLADQLRAKGLEQAKKFSWLKAAEEYRVILSGLKK